jgi:hypothetical protein
MGLLTILWIRPGGGRNDRSVPELRFRPCTFETRYIGTSFLPYVLSSILQYTANFAEEHP